MLAGKVSTCEFSRFALLLCIDVILELQYAGALAVLIVSSPPRLDLTFFAAVPLTPALGTLLVFLAGLSFLTTVCARTLPITRPNFQLLPRGIESHVTRYPQPEERSWHRKGSNRGIATLQMVGHVQK